MMENPQRTRLVNVRVPPVVHETLKNEARLLGMTPSDLASEVLEEWARRVEAGVENMG